MATSILLGISIAAFIIIKLQRKPSKALQLNFLYFIALFGICASIGWIDGKFAQPKEINTAQLKGTILAAKINRIQDKDFSMAIDVTIIKSIGKDCKTEDINGVKARLNIDESDYSLKEGDVMTWKADLKRISNMNNPESFDYATYMSHKGILYTQQVDRDKYVIIGHHDDLLTWAKGLQRSLIRKVLNSDINVESQKFLITILIGDATFIDKDTRTEFSQAGIAHVLALSGLHIGIIAMVIYWLLFPLDRLMLRKLRYVIALILVAGFDIITGLSFSIIRASIMMAFTAIAVIFFRRGSGINALMGSSLFILIFQPAAIFDVGFQLSFASVLSILLISNKVNPVSPRRKWLYYVTSLLTVSLAATIGTAAITACYFHTISIFSFITNIIIVPILPVILTAGIIFLAMLCMGIQFPIIAKIVDFLFSILDKTASMMAAMPTSHIDNVYETPTECGIYVVIIATLVMWIYRNKASYLLFAIGELLILCIVSFAYRVSLPEKGMVIFNDYSSTPILYFENGTGYLWNADDSINVSDFKQYNDQFMAKYGIDQIKTVTNDFGISNCDIKPPFACIMGKKMAIISKSDWKHISAKNKINVDYLIVTKKYYGTVSQLMNTFKPKITLLSGDIFSDRLNALEKECRDSSYNYRNLSTEGGIMLK